MVDGSTTGFPTSSWIRLRDLMARRPLYLFGDGQVAIKTIRSLDMQPRGVLDNFSGYWGRQGICGLPVLEPDYFLGGEFEESSRPCFLITSTAIQAIGGQLDAAGFRAGHDYWVSPVLRDQETIRRMESTQFDLLASSGNAAPQTGLSGGGIYRIRTGETFPDVECVFRGETHGLVPFQDGFLATTMSHGLTHLSSSFEVKRSQTAEVGGRLHGIAVDEERELILVVHTDSDRVRAFNFALDLQFEVPVCPCHEFHRPGVHHANDITVLGDMVVVSMFSASGTYRAQVYDGALAGIRIDGNRSHVTFLRTDLTMPHSVSNFGGTLVVLDSFHGYVLGENFRVVAQLPGFSRGLCEQSGYWLVGQSKNRNFSLLERKVKGTSVDSGIAVLNIESGVFRTIPLPPSVNELHSIVSLGAWAGE